MLLKIILHLYLWTKKYRKRNVKQDDWFIIFVIWLQKDLSIYLHLFE